MGSFSKPRYTAPTPQIVYMPSPTPSLPVGGTVDDGAGADAKKVEDSVRARRLPETVHTSYRGVLEQGEWMPQRKSLLGE